MSRVMGSMRIILTMMTALGLNTGQAEALELSLPSSAKQTGESLRNPDSYMLPLGPFADGALPVLEVEGRVLQQAWRIDQSATTTLQIIRPLRDQLVAAGYEILLDCGGQECGGFDFRLNTRIMPAPDMHIDLFDFRALSARKLGADGTKSEGYASVIVSLSGGAAYVQVIHVTPDGLASELSVSSDSRSPVTEATENTSLVDNLTGKGHVILKDLDFGTGSATLGQGEYASLEALAAFLLANADRRVALVGHTDLVGSLADNVALSNKRAGSVLRRLVEDYDVPASQLESHGVGYLSPLAPNHTSAGRDANRRVEAVLLSAK